MSYSIPLFGATALPGYSLARLYPDTVQPYGPPNGRGPWPKLNLEDPAWLAAFFSEVQPRLLIYCHAVCDVEKCEANPDWAREINVGHIRRLLAALPAATRFVYVSSDHVFGGNGAYDEDSSPCPISVYGQTRVEAERLVLGRGDTLVLRAGLAIGPSHNGRTGHLDWLAYRHRRGLPITIIEDEYRSAVWVEDLSARLMELAQGDEVGLRHIAATRAVCRVELAEYLARRLGIEPTFKVASRQQQPAPHLGRVELSTKYAGDLYQPLLGVLDAPRTAR